MTTLPETVSPLRRTDEFTETTLPDGLRRRHTTKASVWGRIQVLEGSLRYRILEPALEEHVLTPGHPGIVEPRVPHEVEPLGSVRFFVEFFREDARP